MSSFADVKGARMFYEIAGEGDPPLVLIHAGIADSRMWDEQMDAFAARRRVVRYDLRGYGQTAMAAGEFSHRDDLLALLDALEIERAVLVGCSIGGRIAMECALHQPERVAGLVLVCSGAPGLDLPADEPPQWEELVAAFKAGNLERSAELETQVWVDGPHRDPADPARQAIRERVQAMNLIALRTEAAKLGAETRIEPSVGTRFEEIATPTLVIIGDLDQPDIVEGCEIAAGRIPGAQKAIMQGTAHLPNMERPEEFNRTVEAFLAQKGQV